jgi:hypothetical protein
VAKNLTLTSQQDEFLQNVLQNWINLGEPKSPTEVSLSQDILLALREPAASPIVLTDQQDEFLQQLLLDFLLQTEGTNNSSRLQERIIKDLQAQLREP